MNKLLGTFNYKGNLYLIFPSKNNNVNIKAIGKKVDKEECKLAIETVIKEINNLRREFIGKFKYNGEVLELYRDNICNLFFFKKDGKLLDMYDSKYSDLYYSYNFAIYADYYNGYSDDIDSYYYTQMNYIKKQRKKKIKSIIAGGLVTITLFTGTIGAWLGIKNHRLENNDDEIIIDTIEIYDNEERNIEDNLSGYFISNVTNTKSVEDQIREQLKDEEEWVIDAIIEDYHKDKAFRDAIERGEKPNHFLDEKEEINYDNLSEKTSRIVNIINNNDNIKDEFKETLIKYYVPYFETNMKYISNSWYEKICSKIETLNIVEDYNDLGYIIYEDGEKVDGYYISAKNEIVLISKLDSILTHEFNHVLGNLYIDYTMKDLINEGMVENTNPDMRTSTYKEEQIFYTMIEQIYGLDFLKKSYYNGGIRLQAFNQGIELQEEDELLFKTVNDYLRNHRALSEEEKDNPEDIIQRDNAINILKNVYEYKIGESFYENPIINACIAILTKDNSLIDVDDSFEISGIKLNEDETRSYIITKRIDYSYKDGFVSTEANIPVSKEVNIR